MQCKTPQLGLQDLRAPSPMPQLRSAATDILAQTNAGPFVSVCAFDVVTKLLLCPRRAVVQMLQVADERREAGPDAAQDEGELVEGCATDGVECYQIGGHCSDRVVFCDVVIESARELVDLVVKSFWAEPPVV